jgi:hypothetical protein
VVLLRRIEDESCYEEKRQVKKRKPARENQAGAKVAKISSSGKTKIFGALWRVAQREANTAPKTQPAMNPSWMKQGT